MGHIPNIGNPARRENAIADAGGLRPQVLGTIDERLTDPKPPVEGAAWQSPSGSDLEFIAPPPPWETDPGKAESDAHNFVDVPQEWSLRWINPKLLDQFGWRYWQPVMGSDPRVKVKVDSMVDVNGNIRRGGQTGDILAWMYTAWVEDRRRRRIEQARHLAGVAATKREELNEEFRRGTFGPYVRGEAHHTSEPVTAGNFGSVAR